MDADRESKKITANSEEELDKKVQELIAQGWDTEGGVIKDPDGTFSQNMGKG